MTTEAKHTAGSTSVMYDVEFARRTLADAGYIARVSATGRVLCIYDGDVDDPGTWMECERIAIRDGRVDSHAVGLLCESA